MIKIVKNYFNSLLLPCVDEEYVNRKLCEVIQSHGISVGETSLSFRGYDPMDEYRYPLKGSESTENHIKYKDIAIINERSSFWEILLWNGYMYSLSRNCSSKHLVNTYRDVRNMSYFALKRPVTAKEVGNNISLNQ